MSDTYYIEFGGDPSKDGEVYKRYSSKNQPFKSIFIDVEVTELILKSTHDQIVKRLEAEIEYLNNEIASIKKLVELGLATTKEKGK